MGFNGVAGSSSQPLPREDSPLLPQDSNLSSSPKTFANVFIAIVGAGVLGLPYTFKKTGWLLGVVMLLFVALLTYHCMMLLIYTRRKLESRKECLQINSFGDLGFAVCGSIGRFAVDSMIVLSQAGFCVGYLIFIGNTLVYLFNSSSSSHQSQRIWGIKPKTFYIWSCFPFQLGLNSIPTLTHLAPLSIFADFVQIGAMGVVMVEDVMIFLKQQQVLKTFGDFSVVFYGLGVSVYAFEGMGMALPLESETKDKARFGKVLGLSMGFISCIYAAFGVLGYFAFGAETNDIITTNFGKGLVSYVVQLALCINLFFTFPLMMNPVYEVFERRFSDGRYSLWLRWILVLGVSLVALMVPNFADFMSLVGSSVCSVLGFVLPALFHLLAFKDDIERRGKFLDVAIMCFGLVLGVSGTWSSILQISPATD
ncbi:Amino acid transporter avt3c [Thalictrum thalictroides]|uniref:Amino acid transporter avt3c n=1 Tax=Thalictrum thalictroides TaxID=46969 RepID=A0A7J6XF93_THATH|nr:Amino acid transporter avt3c [Thalictrum thalictroides]